MPSRRSFLREQLLNTNMGHSKDLPDISSRRSFSHEEFLNINISCIMKVLNGLDFEIERIEHIIGMHEIENQKRIQLLNDFIEEVRNICNIINALHLHLYIKGFIFRIIGTMAEQIECKNKGGRFIDFHLF